MSTPHAELLRDADLRVTAPRLAVLAEVAARPHATAEEIRSAVHDRLGAVSTQAVYDVLHALTAARIRAGDPAIIGLVVRAPPAQLRTLAQRPGVRAVEALPSDAVWGRFAVRPLQPQQLETASPLPDAGPVPAS